MFGISGFELLIILALVLIIFGPDKLPQLARSIGRAMAMFKRAQEDMERVIRAEMITPVATTASAEADVPATPEEGADTTPPPAEAAAEIWAATDEDDEEDDEE